MSIRIAWFSWIMAAIIFGLAGVNQKTRVMADQAHDPVYKHFFYLRHNPDEHGTATTDSLMHARVTRNGFEERVVYSKNNLHIAWEPLLAAGGKFYGLIMDKLICIDLANGNAEELEDRIGVHGLADGMLYARVGDSLRIYDLVQRAYRNAGKIGSHDRNRSGGSLSISPDRNFVSFFARVIDPLIEGQVPPGFKLHLVDIGTGKITISGPEVPAITYLTGGGTADEGPSYVWLDPATIILVREESNQMRSAFSNGIDLESGALSTVCKLNITTEQLTDIVALPRWNRSLGEPYFRGMLSDGVPRIVLGEMGQFEIDLKAKCLIEDDLVQGDYRFNSGKPPQRIAFGETTLDEADRIVAFFAAPDGRRAVWMIRNPSTTSLFYHDSNNGDVRNVATGWFPTSSSRIPSDKLSIIWARDEDFEPAPHRIPDGWKAIPPVPFPAQMPPIELDLRPLASDVVEYAISTGKPVYQFCEPVEFTVTLTNKTDRELSFTAPRGYRSYFNVCVNHPYGSELISDFDDLDKVFLVDPVVIAPGKSFRCSRNIEPSGTGVHKLSAALSRGMIPWRGPLTASPVEFTVESSPDGSALFLAKYKRQMERCRAEFDQDPSTCNTSRISDMGTGVAPLLIEELTGSNDAKFRQRMSGALVQLGSPEALPYFQRLLKGELEDDREMVLSGLVVMIERGSIVDRARLLLISATKHSNVEVRRGAVGRLTKLHDPKIREALEAAVSDNDDQVARRAARHLAALEDFDLADWLTVAIDEPSEARYLASKSIVADLEQIWGEKKGAIPEVSWTKAFDNQKVIEAYRETLRDWRAFASQYPRESSHFFDDDRNPRNHNRK